MVPKTQKIPLLFLDVKKFFFNKVRGLNFAVWALITPLGKTAQEPLVQITRDQAYIIYF